MTGRVSKKNRRDCVQRRRIRQKRSHGPPSRGWNPADARIEPQNQHDIDLFIRDPQWIGFLSPRLNDKVGDLVHGYEEDATFLKLKFPEGEIDFIVRMSLTGLPSESSEKSRFLLEPVEEVLAKKLFYRGASLTPRDLFDWACVESMHPEALDVQRVARVIHTRLEGIHTIP